MKKITFGANFTVFLLFFGLAALEAFRTAEWFYVALWIAIGLVFLLADNFSKARGEH